MSADWDAIYTQKILELGGLDAFIDSYPNHPARDRNSGYYKCMKEMWERDLKSFKKKYPNGYNFIEET